METKNLAVQSIPIAKIMANPKNPRRFKKPGAVEAKMASLKAIGQKTPAKLWRLSEAEKAETAQATGLPACPYEYGIIGGHLRWEAAQRLGWEFLNALVYDLTPDDVLLEAVMDNEDQKPHWLDRYQGYMDILQTQPGLTQAQLADLIGTDQQSISRVYKLMSLLDSQGKAVIYGQSVKSEDSYEIRERVAFALTGLEDATKTTPEARELMTKALAVVRKLEMTEAEAKELVEWVKDGSPVETYGEKPEIATPQDTPTGSTGSPQVGAGARNDSNIDRFAEYWKDLPKEVKVTHTKKGYRVVMDLSPSEAVPVVYGAMSNLEFLKGQSGEAEDLRYRNALPQVHKDAVKVWAEEKAERQSAVRSPQLAAKTKTKSEKPEIATPQNAPTGSTGSPQVGAGTRNDSGLDHKGFLGKIGDVIQKKTGLSPQDIKDSVENNLAKDAKQAANYQVRRVMRNFLRNIFKN